MSGRRTIIRNDITTGSITSQGGAIAQPARAVVASQPKRASKERIKSSTVAIYISVFVLLVAIIAVGYRAPEEVAEATAVANTPVVSGPTADDVVTTHIAAKVASAAQLSIAGYASELAVSTSIEHKYASADDGSSISKPTIVELSSASRNITTYTVLAGETVPSVAAKFGISADTLRWANNLVGDTLGKGKVLDILPRTGIAYTVKDGDSVKSIAEKYKSDVLSITTYNDLEEGGLVPGLKIIVPDGVLPTNERPGYVAPVYTFTTGYGTWSGNVLSARMFFGVDANSGGYAGGNCTAYAYWKRAAIGRPISTQFGNAYTWAAAAAASGYLVNNTPEAGAVIQAGNHVGVVEEVLSNGDLRITDMNYGYRPYLLAERIIPAGTVHLYKFIH